METDTFSLGVMFILFIAVFRLYQTSAWFRLDEKKYREHYEKSTKIFNFMKSNKDYYAFRKNEKIQFIFVLFVLFGMLFFYVL